MPAMEIQMNIEQLITAFMEVKTEAERRAAYAGQAAEFLTKMNEEMEDLRIIKEISLQRLELANGEPIADATADDDKGGGEVFLPQPFQEKSK